jgi:hypothetical protein
MLKSILNAPGWSVGEVSFHIPTAALILLMPTSFCHELYFAGAAITPVPTIQTTPSHQGI